MGTLFEFLEMYYRNIIVFLFYPISITTDELDRFPQWQDLKCEQFKYLFSEEYRTWDDALAECNLYGGWLADVGSIWEQNCILRYGKSQNFDDWYWMGAHSPDRSGVFVYEHTNEDVAWFSPRWSCGDDYIHARGGDAFEIGIFTNEPRDHGRWCDSEKNGEKKFICKGNI